MALPQTMNIKGKSGADYLFYIYNLPVTFGVYGGIYFYTKQVPNDTKHYYVYIGITGDLSTRFDNHHKAPEIKKAGATHICIHWEENEEKRKFIEKDILTAVSTICNDIMN